jgi:hypothetical protein
MLALATFVLEALTLKFKQVVETTANVASLYHTNNLKLATTAAGIDITGDISLTDTSPAITFTDTSVVNLEHKINSSSDNLRLSVDLNDVDATGRLEFFVGSATNQIRFGKTESSFNEISQDIDFRVESNNKANMLFVDAGNDRVGIGNGVPETTFHVTESTAGAMATFESTSANNSGGPNIKLWRNSSTPESGDGLSRLIFQGMNSAAERIDYVEIQTEIEDVTDGAEDGLFQIETLVTGTSRNRLLINSAETAFNDGGRNLDFRVESDGASHMLFVDAGSNRVGIGESAPGNPLHVTTSSAGDILTLESTDAGTGVGPSINLYRNSSSPAANDLGPALYWRGENSIGGQHTYANIYSQYTNVTDGTEACNLISQISVLGVPRSVLSLLASSTSVVVNDESQDIDFRVESDTNTHALFVDAGNTRVGIAESAPESQLHIKQTGDIGTGNAMGLMIESGTSTQRYMLQTGRTGVSNAYFNLRDVSNSRDIWSVLNTDGTFQGHTPFQWNNAAVFNDGSQDYDFRVESAGNENMLFVDASANAVAIGHNTPLVPFHVKTTGSGEVVRIENTNADASQGPIVALYRNSPSPADNDGIGRINFLGEDSAGNQTTYNYINATITDVSNGTEDSKISMGVLAGGAARSAFILDGGTGATFNEDGIAAGDFRVESDSNTHMLFVDAGNNVVGINETNPT